MQRDSSPRGQWTAPLVSGLIGYDFKRQAQNGPFRGLEGSDVLKNASHILILCGNLNNGGMEDDGIIIYITSLSLIIIFNYTFLY